MPAPERPGAVGAAALLVAVAVALTGCGSDAVTRTAGPAGTARLTEGLPAASSASATSRPAVPSATEGPFGADGPDASDTPDPGLSDQPTPTLPPGDPGTDDPDADPDADGDEPAATTGPPPVTVVPAEALLDATTVGAVAGGRWTAQDTPRGWCTAPRAAGSDVWRAALLDSDAGRLVEAVSAFRTARAAEAAVARTASRLEACGWRDDHDPRLGAASEQLTRTAPDGTEQVALVLAADGVGVVLVASGSAAAQGSWESLADLALGSSCLAAVDGCH
jgi:hypothetical protein